MKHALARLVLALGLSVGMLACNGATQPEPAQAEAPREYTTRGVVREITAGRSVSIEHEDVPGYMPAMTMPFEIGSVALTGIAVGTRVEFRFRPEAGGRHVLTSIRAL